MAGSTFMGLPRDAIPWAPSIDPERCIGCGDCLDVCPNGVYALNEQTNQMDVVNPGQCVVLCDKCAGYCPQEAIRFPDKEVTKAHLRDLLRSLPASSRRPPPEHP